MPRVRLNFTRPFGALALLTLLLFTLLAIPGVTPWYLGPAAALETLLTAAPFALAYFLAGWGLGSALLPSSPAPSGGGVTSLRVTEGARATAALTHALQLPLGLALMLTLSHLMGILGLLRTGTLGLVLAYLPITIGIILLATSPSRTRRNRAAASLAPAKHSYLLLAAAPALAALFLAACAPPGTLWQSEARGFDALSYHLQLPREWLAAGRIQPLEHNAYSWLPSYMEAAYTHLGAMTSFLVQDPFTQSNGPATIASQLLHALIAIAAAITVGQASSSLVARASSPPDSRFPSTLAALLFLTTPWIIVTASLAYNEMPVCLVLAAALVVCETESFTPIRRGALIGLLVGAACCAKPTALFMVGVPVGILLLIRTPRRDWLRTLSAAAIVGLIMLTPWLIRNAIACGNPVFPYLTSLFGDAHWSPLEVARWKLGHQERGSLLLRLSYLVSGRGFGHAQWGPIAVGGVASALVLFTLRRSHLIAALTLLLLGVQVSLWLGIGHLQSRFLLPTAPLLVLPIAAAACFASTRWPQSTISLVAAGAIAASSAPVWFLFRESFGAPGALINAGVPFLTGESLAHNDALTTEERRRLEPDLAPQQFINLGLAGPIRRLYLLGDSTPFYYHVPVLYHTTWDPSPLGLLLREYNANLAQAAQQLAAPPNQPGGGRGVSHVLINFSELQRLHSDHWYDPDATPAVAEQLIRDHARIIKEWQPASSARIVLIELVPNAP